MQRTQALAFQLILLVTLSLATLVPAPANALIGGLTDNTPPTGSVAVNGGAASTTRTSVTLSVPASDKSGVSQVRISNSAQTSGGLLQLHRTYAYSSRVTWDLADTATGGSRTAGVRTVYVQWKDKAGNWSPVAPDSIRLNLLSEETRFLNLLNSYRKGKGLPTLAISPRLTKGAKWMSADMGAKRYFSHTDSLGRVSSKRMAAFGYTYNTYKGENLAAGHSTADSVFKAWLGSASHKKNMDNPNYRAIGIGTVYTKGSPHGWYWTTKFGGYVDR